MPDETPRIAFARRLKLLRQERGVSTFAVAESILESRDRASEVTKWESGKHFPTPENLVKIAEYFACSTDYLLGVTDNIQMAVPA